MKSIIDKVRPLLDVETVFSEENLAITALMN